MLRPFLTNGIFLDHGSNRPSKGPSLRKIVPDSAAELIQQVLLLVLRVQNDDFLIDLSPGNLRIQSDFILDHTLLVRFPPIDLGYWLLF